MGPTVVNTFFATAGRLRHKIALRQRGEGGWDEISWLQYAASVRRAAHAFLALGVQTGERVGILSHNRPEWLYSDLGALSVGAATVPIYPSLIAAQLEHVLVHSEMRIIIVEDEAHFDKVQSIRSNCPSLQHVILLQGKKTGSLDWNAFLDAGDEYLSKHPNAFGQAQAQISPDKLATIVYTSGTTGPPKGAMLSHRNLIFEAQQLGKLFDMGTHDQTLSFLPLSHVAERLQGEVMAVYAGMTVNFGRGIDTVREDLLATRPSIVVCVPRLWEKMHEAILANVAKAPRRRRALFQWATQVAGARWRARVQGNQVSLAVRLQARLAKRLVGIPLRQHLGLDRARLLVSGAAPLSPILQEFFAGMGLPIMEAYGQTECMGISHCSPSQAGIRPGSIGKQFPDIEVRLAADGEILIRGDNVFMGYFKDDKASAEALQEGWLHTGDIGSIDQDGYLKLTDRKKDIIVTAGGKNVAPQNIENLLKAQPGISQAVVLGDKRKYLVALVTVDSPAMEQAMGQALAGKVSENEGVRARVDAAIRLVNRDLSNFETVKRFAILDRDFSVEGGELTPTLKVKRRVIDKRYAQVIDGLYGA